MDFPNGSGGKESAYNAGDTTDMGSISGLGRSPGGGNGNLLQYSWLQSSMDRGVWRTIFHRVAELDTTECVHVIHTPLDKLFLHLYHLEPKRSFQQDNGQSQNHRYCRLKGKVVLTGMGKPSIILSVLFWGNSKASPTNPHVYQTSCHPAPDSTI